MQCTEMHCLVSICARSLVEVDLPEWTPEHIAEQVFKQQHQQKFKMLLPRTIAQDMRLLRNKESRSWKWIEDIDVGLFYGYAMGVAPVRGRSTDYLIVVVSKSPTTTTMMSG